MLVEENFVTRITEVRVRPIAREVAAIYGRRLLNVAIKEIVGKQGRVLSTVPMIER
jgi:hypothetical protein